MVLSVSSSSWCLGRAAVCDCGTPWTFLLLFSYPTDRPKAVVPLLVFLFGALWFNLRCDLFYVLPCVNFVLVFFSYFSIAITSLGEERANLSSVRAFV